MGVKVPLSTPIEAHGETIRELEFREPRLGDLRGVNLTVSQAGLTFDAGAVLDLAAKLAGVPPSAIDKLGLKDLEAVAGAVLPLLDGLPGMSATSPPTSPSSEE